MDTWTANATAPNGFLLAPPLILLSYALLWRRPPRRSFSSFKNAAQTAWRRWRFLRISSLDTMEPLSTDDLISFPAFHPGDSLKPCWALLTRGLYWGGTRPKTFSLSLDHFTPIYPCSAGDAGARTSRDISRWPFEIIRGTLVASFSLARCTHGGRG